MPLKETQDVYVKQQAPSRTIRRYSASDKFARLSSSISSESDKLEE